MEEERKKLLFVFVFSTYLPVFYSNFDQESSLDVEFDSASNKYPHCIILTDPATPKIRNNFKVFLSFWVVGSVKSMKSGYSLDAEFNSTSNELS